MIIELLCKQVPAYWPQIRLAGIKSDGIEPEFQEEYANTLLTDLLAGKKSCFVSVTSDKQPKNIMIGSVMENSLKKVKYFKIFNVFGLMRHTPEDWQIFLEDLKAICKKHSCVGIAAEAAHEHIKNVMLTNGFKVFTTTLHYYI